MGENISVNPNPDFPKVEGVSPAIVEDFFTSGFVLDSLEELQAGEGWKNLVNAQKAPNLGLFIPEDPGLTVSPEVLLKIGAGKLAIPSHKNNGRYGTWPELKANFSKWFELMDEEKGRKIASAVSEALGVPFGWEKAKQTFLPDNTTDYGVEGKNFRADAQVMVVLDPLGQNGSIRAYAFPHIVITPNPNLWGVIPPKVEKNLKDTLRDNDIEPWRVGKVTLNPRARGPQDDRLYIFLAK